MEEVKVIVKRTIGAILCATHKLRLTPIAMVDLE